MNELWQLTATEIADKVRSKELSAVEVTAAHLKRLADVNPEINAVVQEFADEATGNARKVDDAITRGEDPGLLCGVPVTIKDSVDQAGHVTSRGLRLFAEKVAHSDNTIVANTKKAGAVIVGRTNAPAFLIRWFSKNNLYGQTLNPVNKAITPGGSSGGASASVAAGICPIAHGTDIAGSIRYPAYACGIHGLRPTLGRIPAQDPDAGGRFIGGQLMAVSGPLARSIADLELALAAMSAPDPRDAWNVPMPLVGGEYPKRVAITLTPDGMPTDDVVSAAILEAADMLRDAGWTVEEVACPPMRPAAHINETLWMAEVDRASKDLIAEEAEPDSMFVFEQMYKRVAPLSYEAVMDALKLRSELVREWEVFLHEYPVVLCPISAELPFEQQLDVQSEASFARVFEAQLTQRALPALGVPALAVGTGQRQSRPIGVQLVAARFREDILFDAGRAIERACPPVLPVHP